MGDLLSTLTLRLVDQVSGPSKKVNSAIRQTDVAARRAQRGGIGGVATRTGQAAALAGSRFLIAAGGVTGVAYATREAIKSFAELERQMNRVGITAGASVGEVKAATTDVATIANQIGMPLEQVVGGLEALVAAGRSLPEAMSFLPSVVKTAHAAGAEVSDIASAAGALASSLKIAGPQMQSAFDILVAGGNAGKFELKDMARYLPSLAASAAAVGLKGEAGLMRLVAMLQVVRSQVGSSEEAASSMNNLFAKMESEETAKRFGKFGVNFRKEMAKARREGKDLVETFLDLVEVATKGDMSKLPQLIGDMEFSRGVRALIARRSEIKRLEDQFRSSAGATNEALKRVSSDTQSGADRLSNKWSELYREIGGLAAAPGVGLMEGFLQDIRAMKGELQDFDKWVQQTTGFTLGELANKAGKALGVATPEEQKAANDRREAERNDPQLARAREKAEEAKKLRDELDAKEKKLRQEQADLKAIPPNAERWGTTRETRDRIAKLKEDILGLREKLGANQLDQISANTPASGPVDIPIDRQSGRSSFHTYRAQQQRERKAHAATPLPHPGQKRGITPVPVTPMDDPFAPKAGSSFHSYRAKQARSVAAELNGAGEASAAGQKTGAAFREGLNSELDKATQEINAFIQNVLGKLNTNVSPTITPKIAPTPGAAPISAPASGTAVPSARQALRRAAHDTRVS